MRMRRVWSEGSVETLGHLRPPRPLQHRLHGGDRLGAAPGGEIGRGAQRAVELARRAVARRLDQPVEFGRGGFGAAGALQQLDHGDVALGVLGGRAGLGAQKGLGAVEILPGDVPADQVGTDLLVLGEHLVHLLELGPQRVLVVQPRQELGAQHVELVGGRRVPERGIGLFQRPGGVFLAQQRVDHHPARRDRGGIVGQHRAGQFHGGRLAVGIAGQDGGAIGQGRGDRPGADAVGVQRHGRFAVADRLVPVAPLQRHQRQRLARLDGVGILLDQAQVLAVGLGDVAALHLQPGVERARLLVEPVVVEDVAQLDQGAVGVVLFQVGQRGLVEALGLFLFALASGEQGGGEKKGGQKAEYSDHITCLTNGNYAAGRFRLGTVIPGCKSTGTRCDPASIPRFSRKSRGMHVSGESIFGNSVIAGIPEAVIAAPAPSPGIRRCPVFGRRPVPRPVPAGFPLACGGRMRHTGTEALSHCLWGRQIV